MTGNFLHRLRHRWAVARRFSRAACGWRDIGPLFLAGIARQRPFAGNSAYARLGRMGGPIVKPRVAGGSRLALDLRDATDLMIFEEIFLDGIYPLDSVPFAPDVVVDCGACAGFFTLLVHARHAASQFHLFEPNPVNLTRLRHNLALNAIDATVHAAAVGIAAGTARFCGEGFGGHLAGRDTAKSIEVVVVDLARFLRETRPQRLLLKIDIEGAEATLLPTLESVLPPTTALFLETHQPEAVWRGYLQPLLNAGFRHHEIRRRHDSAAGTDYVEHVLLRT